MLSVTRRVHRSRTRDLDATLVVEIDRLDFRSALVIEESASKPRDTGRDKLMQIRNIDPPVRLTGRHVIVTEAMEDYFHRRLAALHVDYPTILEVHAILGLEKYRHRVDVILRCNRHITIKTSAETDDMYASIDQAIDRVARQMRKYHTRLMCAGLPRRRSVRRARLFSR